MSSWTYAACETCDGSGKIDGRQCTFCSGTGFWEFVADDNHLALRVLRGEIEPDKRIKDLCNRRLKQVTPKNVHLFLGVLEIEQIDFDALQQAGAERWG